ncbi:hypothetical protein C8D92_104122 [Tamilnaduibacter salinus]|uniref:Uncharacterized protein n=1 Tax=Tamilnaduibacter salinus TaxID=1484056 RepID=A0A2U1CXB0_9GAMM|nr:hypothetical protein [Tamilnaduibacter salinus]PVY76891.1 hypothetical protein C8D92_104122 [Tamilnaduibacter salinus]
MIEPGEVFEAVRRGYNEFEAASNSEILDYFSSIDAGAAAGHASHIKGILFEQEYVDLMEAQAIEAQVFEATNHPITDVAILDGDNIVQEIQLKATDSSSYIGAAVEENPDVGIVATSEAAASFDGDMVVDSGIEDAALEQAISETLLDEAFNPVSPVSVIGWMFGLPF